VKNVKVVQKITGINLPGFLRSDAWAFCVGGTRVKTFADKKWLFVERKTA
jgi:hypothetical protein